MDIVVRSFRIDAGLGVDLTAPCNVIKKTIKTDHKSGMFFVMIRGGRGISDQLLKWIA
jgi:hypothetical protein